MLNEMVQPGFKVGACHPATDVFDSNIARWCMKSLECTCGKMRKGRIAFPYVFTA